MTYDLEERCFQFALAVRKFAQENSLKIYQLDDIKQLIRSSGSVGANYIEANDSVSDKDKLYRLRISKKEAKESKYWARQLGETATTEEHKILFRSTYKEADELMKIFATIIKKLCLKF